MGSATGPIHRPVRLQETITTHDPSAPVWECERPTPAPPSNPTQNTSTSPDLLAPAYNIRWLDAAWKHHHHLDSKKRRQVGFHKRLGDCS